MRKLVLGMSALALVASAAAFEEAKQLLASESPDLLLTGLRLGPYNGLHLILRSRIDHPDMAAIVMTHVSDPVLEAEAQRQHAGFLLRPLSDRVLLDAITRSLSGAHPAAGPDAEAAAGGY